jgi:DNA-binding NarL/FixJ family response regulator
MTIRVILLDDDDRYRQRLVDRLGFAPTLSVVADASTPAQFFDLLSRLSPPPAVALVDIGLDHSSGIDVADQLSEAHPEMGIIMLTVFEDDAHLLGAIQAGASGYLLKDTPVDALAAAITEVAEGGVPLSRSIARRILTLAGRPRAGIARVLPPGADTLSARERELLEHVVSGDKETAIAARLGISPHTVRTHIKNIYRKLRVTSRAAAVRFALEQGLVDPPPR